MPRVSYIGLDILRPLTRNSIKLKAVELLISCIGYTAPEDGKPGRDKTKSDVYAFGVVLLELLSGRHPFDSSRPQNEQHLLGWARPRLLDYSSLKELVDPTIKTVLSSRTLFRFADVVIMCIQLKPGQRATMSEVLESLQQMNRTSIDGTDDVFETPATSFLGSP